MTPKEILYIDDALSHAQFLSKQCREAAGKLQDAELKRQVQQLTDAHCQLYTQFYNII